METLNTTAVNERRHRVRLDRHEIKRVVTEAVVEHLGIRRNARGVTVNIAFEDEIEGSPAYRVGTRCIVEVIEDLSDQAVAPVVFSPIAGEPMTHEGRAG